MNYRSSFGTCSSKCVNMSHDIMSKFVSNNDDDHNEKMMIIKMMMIKMMMMMMMMMMMTMMMMIIKSSLRGYQGLNHTKWILYSFISSYLSFFSSCAARAKSILSRFSRISCSCSSLISRQNTGFYSIQIKTKKIGK